MRSVRQYYLTLNKSEMVIVISWMRPPPAIPCMPRPVISMGIPSALAQMIDATKKRATAVRRIGFRPQISDKLAQMLELAALARR